MTEQPGLHPLPLSNHGPAPDASPVAPVHPKEVFSVNLMLRRRTEIPDELSPNVIGAQPPRRRRYLSYDEFESSFGADPADVALVQEFANANRLTVTQVNIARRTVGLTGTAEQFSQAFATNLFHFALRGGTYRGHQGPLNVPAALSSVITAVIGLDERPVAVPMARVRSAPLSPEQIVRSQQAALTALQQHVGNKVTELNKDVQEKLKEDDSVTTLTHEYERLTQLAANRTTPIPDISQQWNGVVQNALRSDSILSEVTTDYLAQLARIWDEGQRLAILAALDEFEIKTPPGVARLYEFPEDADGSGQSIGVIELGGGYLMSDLTTYFAFLGVPTPQIVDVSVAGGMNQPGVNEPFDSEVALDLEVAGGAAPGAKLVCYFAPLTALGFIEAVHTAIHDRVNQPSVISASWDLSEAFWLEAPMYVSAFEEVLKEAALLGVTICCSAGDYGAASEFHDGRAWVDYPASSPYVLGCGGTSLYSRGNQILQEIVWNTEQTFRQATGGGVSQIFPLPKWQDRADIPESVNVGGGRGRGVPDIAANGDPSTGYLVQLDGRSTVICGTSSGAPLWAALIARINQSLGVRVGFINPFLYDSVNKAEAFRDILIVGNGVYSARPGWDACTGWGTPRGANLRDALGVEA